MELKSLLIVLVIIGAITGGVWFLYSGDLFNQKTQEENKFFPDEKVPVSLIEKPKKGEYISFKSGEKKKVVLVNSNFSYGLLPPDINRGACPIEIKEHQDFKPGDACVIINGTVKNEYDEGKYICLSGQIYNKKERSMGHMVKCPFVTIFVNGSETGFFEMYIKHDKQNIVRYDIFMNCVSEITPP